MSENELRECPFCGEHAVLISDGRWNAGCASIHCIAFTTELRYKTRAAAIAAWNTRASTPALDELVAAARAVSDKSCSGDPECATCCTEYVVPWQVLRRLEHAVESALAAYKTARKGGE